MPLSVYVYFKYGRPINLSKGGDKSTHAMGHGHDHGAPTSEKVGDLQSPGHAAMQHPEHHIHHAEHAAVSNGANDATIHGETVSGGHPMHNGVHHETEHADHSGMHHPTPQTEGDGTGHPQHRMAAHQTAASSSKDDVEAQKQRAMHAMHSMHGPSADRPMWATVAMGVMHCGAGCVLGDIVGEFIVYGSGATINGADIWPALLIDYAFALLFGIAFQYFSIAPMTGDYGLKTVWRALKADILSLTAFEIGLFGWMIIYQVGIWGYRLEMNTWVYWWMMQVCEILTLSRTRANRYRSECSWAS